MPQPSPLHSDGDDVLLDVWVVPGAGRTEHTGLHDGALRVRVAAPASAGAANRALVKFLSKQLGGAVTIERGTASRRKRLRVAGRTPADVAKRLDLGASSGAEG